jgi:hypothetical protein
VQQQTLQRQWQQLPWQPHRLPQQTFPSGDGSRTVSGFGGASSGRGQFSDPNLAEQLRQQQMQQQQRWQPQRFFHPGPNTGSATGFGDVAFPAFGQAQQQVPELGQSVPPRWGFEPRPLSDNERLAQLQRNQRDIAWSFGPNRSTPQASAAGQPPPPQQQQHQQNPWLLPHQQRQPPPQQQFSGFGPAPAPAPDGPARPGNPWLGEGRPAS